MKFISDFLIYLGNNTIPIGYVVLIIGILASAFRSIAKLSKIQKEEIQKRIEPEVKKIMQKYPDGDERDAILSKIYKENHFSALRPVLFNILAGIVSAAMTISVLNISSFDTSAYTGIVTFPTVTNVFIRQILIIIPALAVLFSLFSSYICAPKELLKIKDVLLTIGITAVITVLFSNLLAPLYAIYILGLYFGQALFAIPLNLKKREIYFKYKDVAVENNNNTSNPPKKLSIKELKEEAEKAFDKITEKK